MTQSHIKLYSFGSGSSGNCYYLCYDGQGLIIDLGMGVRTIKKHFNTYGISPAGIQAILVTHDHTDHVKGVGALSGEWQIPVCTSQKVHEGMDHNMLMTKKVKLHLRICIEHGETRLIGPFEVTSFAVPHDSHDNNGYLVRIGRTGDTLCVITDAGEMTETMGGYLRQARNVILESNHDETMLERGPYPAHLKRRIISTTGHLSNRAAAEALSTYASPELKRVWLCHLSEENNHPQLAVTTAQAALETLGFKVGDDGLLLHALRRRVPDFFEW